ncbi:hypothetical protein P2H44_01530 [Albimonas sp. CAU 1670]|uniref:hypothetical protein n=1 Tax=Albimonas sp. CAU 1670 TaxID=3032599 RepID=UPI0023DA8ADF|nr:hypothetical protein [Albimonas sp. CAU 1670]MDF2231228.1 hypothetical protein [Albimonas sp. CAU 1670]
MMPSKDEIAGTDGGPTARPIHVATPGRLLIWLVAALIALPTLASAQQQIRLRAGEHAEFSRIALDVPQLAEWSVERNGRLVTVLFPDRELLFETEQIFPQRRVSRVTSARSERGRDGTRLILSMSCACVAEAYEFRPGMLVMDIRAQPEETEAAQVQQIDAGAPDGQPNPQQGEDGGSSTPASGGGGGGAHASSAMDALAIHRPEPPPATSGSVLTPASNGPTGQPQAVESAATPPAAESPTPQESASSEAVAISEAQRRLLEQLARAADQGLVQFRDPGGPDDPREARDDGHASADPAAPDPHAARDPHAPGAGADAPHAAEDQAQTAATPPGPDPEVQLDARTVWDRDRKPIPRRALTCPDDALLDPEPWRRSAEFYDRMGELRMTLMKEFDRPDPRAALDLAWLQVGYGFGAEARQTLAEFVPEVREAALLRDLAHLMDDEPPAADGPLAQGADCPGRAGMWRLAAGMTPDAAALQDPAWRESVLDAFAELPVRLRRRVGPPLVEELTSLGELDFADAARLRLDRAPGDHGAPWRLALGRLALARGEVERGETLLRDVSRTEGPEAAEAMLALADSLLGRRDTLPQDLVEDIALKAFEHQGTELGRRLLVAEILGRAGRDQLGEALEVIETELFAGGARADDLEAALRAILERARAADVGEYAYAAAIMRHRDLIRDPEVFDPARIRVAREMTGIGLANVGIDLLAPALQRGGAEARLAAAAAEVALDLPLDALKRLDGLAGDDASRLRARALLALGRDAEAFAEVAATLPEGSIERARLAWRAAIWSDAARLPGEDPRRLLAAWMAGEPPADPGDVIARALDGAAGSGQAAEATPDPAVETAAREALFLSPPEVAEPPSLAAARRLIEASEAARARIEEALNGV